MRLNKRDIDNVGKVYKNCIYVSVGYKKMWFKTNCFFFSIGIQLNIGFIYFNYKKWLHFVVNINAINNRVQEKQQNNKIQQIMQ